MKAKSLLLVGYQYDEKRDIIYWQVKDVENGEIFTLAWPGSDLAAQFGIKAKLSKELILMFSQSMKDRTTPFNIEIHSTASRVDNTDWMKEKYDEKAPDDTVLNEMYGAHSNLDTYPFKEVIEHIIETDNNGAKQ